MKSYLNLLCLAVFLLLFTALPVRAASVTDVLLQEYQQGAIEPFSTDAGKALWMREVEGRSCTSCHSSSVKTEGKHQQTGKIIQAMSPTVNSKRLTDRKEIEKWFLRNCKWTYGRECTAQEKGNILLWLSQQ